MTTPDPAALCRRVVEMVGHRGDAEVMASAGRSALTRFANSTIHQNVADDFVSVRLRVAVDGRLAASSTNRVDEEGLTRLVGSTIEAAGMRPVDPEWPGVASPTEVPRVDHYDAPTELAHPDVRAGVVSDFVGAGAAGSTAAGFCDTYGTKVAFANSDGHQAEGRTSRSTIEGIHRVAGADGRGWQTSSRVADLDGRHTGTTAAMKAAGGVDAVDLDPGRYEVVLEPACVADMLDFLSAYGFNAKAHIEGRSFVELGRPTFDSSISIWDDATDDRSIGLGFDSEGTPKRRLDLVRQGVCVGVTHDRRTAARAGGGAESTGHALAGGESWGAVPTNLFLGSGSNSPEELVASVERGLLITEFWYTRILDPKTQVVTGLTRSGTFLIEGGRVGAGVRNLRFTQSYVDALAPGNVLSIGNDARQFGGHAVVPSLHLAAWKFTGGARG